MNDGSAGKEIPYYAQWETPELIARIVSREKTAWDDPNWGVSGAESLDEYARWSGHLCGIACLRMILAAYQFDQPKYFDLAMRARDAGVYIESGHEIRGLIYAPFVKFLRREFGIRGEIFEKKETRELPSIISRNDFVMTSVHHTIRDPSSIPPSKGGHLVLIHDFSSQNQVIFHNPSGHTSVVQRNARLSLETFSRFFAGRGIAINKIL